MIGDRLKEAREVKGLTRKAVAEYIKIDQTTYGKYELGKREPDAETLKKLADFYEVSIDFLLEHDYGKENEFFLTVNDMDELKDTIGKVKEYITASIYIAYDKNIDYKKNYKKIIKSIKAGSKLAIDEIKKEYHTQK